MRIIIKMCKVSFAHKFRSAVHMRENFGCPINNAKVVQGEY